MEKTAFNKFPLQWYRNLPVEKRKEPQQHQHEALKKLEEWSKKFAGREAGGILVLPTGAGKTFTAGRFLCSNLISEGYKVVWLAHTHHLLDQAVEGFEDNLWTIADPKEFLRVRVVSGSKSQDDVAEIKPNDDVLIITLQTMSNAYERKHPQLLDFLKSAHGKLCVVFDEAHHSPAPSYKQLLLKLREQNVNMLLLGLTATPTHNDVRKKGWLKRLFPQEVLYYVSRGDLMAQGILSRPIFEDIRTDENPIFEERDYEKWVGTFRDIPEKIIKSLAENEGRNNLIASTYDNDKEKYGKTIIFADHWFQCEALRTSLLSRKVRADTIYSHKEPRGNSADERNQMTRDDKNAQVLDQFRKGELDVIINVRMLTEGTDVPNVQSVFMTRQTTSNILLTQMVGRALRGEKFGGTKEAFIVTFTDNWNQPINWADYSELEDGNTGEGGEYGKRPPIHLISIELVRQLTRQLNSGVNVSSKEFLRCMPVGWYRVEFQASVESRADIDADIESVRQLVMVFDDEVGSYKGLIEWLRQENLEAFASERIQLEDVVSTIDKWTSRFFGVNETVALVLRQSYLFQIARHMAQNDKESPRWFPYEERDLHDLDVVAKKIVEEKLDPTVQEVFLNEEYNSKDLFWRTIYPGFWDFKSACDGFVNRLLARRRSGGATIDTTPPNPHTEEWTDQEVPDAVKREVILRDVSCRCCREKKGLQVDHIIPRYYGVWNEPENLQALCRQCNKDKGIKTINFRNNRNHTLVAAPTAFPSFALPKGDQAKKIAEWEKSVRRHFNFYYEADAVSSTKISAKGTNFYEWEIEFCQGNDPSWVIPHLPKFLERIRSSKADAGLRGPEGCRITSRGFAEVASIPYASSEDKTPSPVDRETSSEVEKTSLGRNKSVGVDGIPNGTLCDFIYHDKKYSGKISDGKFIVRGFGRYDSLSAASRAITRKARNGWTDWHIKLPNREKYIRADKWKKEVANGERRRA